MARERWFYAHDDVRHGPHQLPELVDALLALPEPRSRLVWSRGLESWTRAARVPQVSEQLAELLPGTEPAGLPRDPTPPPRASAAPFPVPATPPAVAVGLPKPILFGGGALLLTIAVAAAYVGMSGSPAEPPRPTPATLAGSAATSTGAAVDPGAGADPGPGPGAAAATGVDGVSVVGWAEEETELPAEVVAQLKGVAGWEDDNLTVTLYNGSRWRITEILVRTSIIEDGQFVDSALLYPLVPKQEVDANVAPILERVAPERRRPTVNPDDTRPFIGKAGQKPRAYRWRIESAQGHAPIRR